MRTLFVAALEEETAALPSGADVLHVGVGKVAAAVGLAHHLAVHRDTIDLVVNVGSAGGLHDQPVGTVIEVARVSQHDVDHTGIERLVGRAMPGGPITLPGPTSARGHLVTGDRLIADEQDRARLAAHAEVVDMEGYAIAAVCQRFAMPVWLVKAVSDGAGEHAARDWRDGLAQAAAGLGAWVRTAGLA